MHGTKHEAPGTARSTQHAARGTPSEPAFRRELGLFDAAVVVVGGIVGVGIFANPSNVARVLGTPAEILLAWSLGGVVALLGGFVWAELASRFPHVGGQYVYLTRAYHPVVGFLYGIALLFIINGGSLAAVSILFAQYLDRTFVALGPAGIRVAAAAALIALTAVNAVGVRAGKRTNNVFMAAKVAGMVVLVALAFIGGGSRANRLGPVSGFSQNLSHGVAASALGATAPLGPHLSWLWLQRLFTALVPILFAYGGWQSCANIAGEIKDPARNLPRANVAGVIVVVVLYLLLNVAYLRVLTPQQVAASPALAADMARAVAGDAGARFVALLIVISSLGFLAVVILTGPRLYYAMAADGVLFERAGRLHPRYQTPVAALWLQAAVSLTLLATNTYDQLLSYVVFADWLFFGLTAGALLIVRHRESTAPGTALGTRHLAQHAARSTQHPSPVPGPACEVARVPGHPYTTLLFVAIAAGVVLNSFIAYSMQSLIGSAILATAAAAYFVVHSREKSSVTQPESAR